MTRKDYPMLAEIIRRNRVAYDVPALSQCMVGADALTRAIADALKTDNPAFDKARFLHDCGVSP